jgi:BRO family, N-terminal domain
MLSVNESGLYALIFTSRKTDAKRFRKWVTNEVLPAIRQTGRYVGYSENDPDPIIVWSKLLGVRPSDVITKGFSIGYLTGGPINPPTTSPTTTACCVTW